MLSSLSSLAHFPHTDSIDAGTNIVDEPQGFILSADASEPIYKVRKAYWSQGVQLIKSESLCMRVVLAEQGDRNSTEGLFTKKDEIARKESNSLLPTDPLLSAPNSYI